MSTTRTISSVDPVSPATERMLGLSDALFGIAITFLALDFGSEVPKSSLLTEPTRRVLRRDGAPVEC